MMAGTTRLMEEAQMEDAVQHIRPPRCVGVVGLGLIGGSFAKAYADAGMKVLAHDIDKGTLAAACGEGTVAAPLTRENVGECDAVVVALYPQDTVDWVTEHAELFGPDVLVIDCGGVKRPICEPLFEAAERAGFAFMGGHPMAGTHHSGFRYARSDLFAGQPMVLVPPAIFSPELIDRAKAVLDPAGFGSYAVTTPETHDRLIAYTSQLAHVVSSAFAKSPTALKHKGFSAGSYKDLTRVAELNPDMWTELFLDNADNLDTELDRVIVELQRYREAIGSGDREGLRRLLAEGSAAKLKADGRYADIQGLM